MDLLKAPMFGPNEMLHNFHFLDYGVEVYRAAHAGCTRFWALFEKCTSMWLLPASCEKKPIQMASDGMSVFSNAEHYADGLRDAVG